MKLVDLLESLDKPKGGSFVGVRFTKDTIDNLVGYMGNLGLDNPEPADELHTTLVIDKENPIDWMPQDFAEPLAVDPQSFSMDLFGQDRNILVLKYDCDELSNRHMAGQEMHGLTWDHPEYSPHVTLAYLNDSDFDFGSIAPPDFSLGISHEFVQPFNTDYGK